MTLAKSILIGALGFCLVSLIAFATVAFGERWMYVHLGLAGAYLMWIAIFIIAGGAVLGSLVKGRWRLPKFYLLFAIAFFAYAAGWVGAYFTLRGTLGEWVGSLVGSVLMALVFAIAFTAMRSLPKLCGVLFVTNSLGYFAGSALYETIGGPPGMLLWGVAYGLFLGGGIGTVLWLAQNRGSGRR